MNSVAGHQGLRASYIRIFDYEENPESGGGGAIPQSDHSVPTTWPFGKFRLTADPDTFQSIPVPRCQPFSFLLGMNGTFSFFLSLAVDSDLTILLTG